MEKLIATKFGMVIGHAHCPSELYYARHHHYADILHNKTAKIIKPKLASVSFCRKSHCFKTANVKILSANSKHRC